MQRNKIFIAHSNSGQQLLDWHARRENCARNLGYKIETMAMMDYHPYTIFPYLDKKWKKRDTVLMRFYEKLGEKIADSDIFIHYNGALIHPKFLQQFTQLKIYHCADDPEASDVISRPVVHAYDIHAISNPTCLDLYRSWGCKHVFFWPLGAFHYDFAVENRSQTAVRDISLSFVGTKYGVTRWRYVHRIPILKYWSGLYTKKAFFDRLEQAFPSMVAYGGGWRMGRIEDSDIPDLYRRTLVGINVHNNMGVHNGRLFDLAAYGVCQICDNKQHLHHVFVPGKEIIGYESTNEAIDLIRYYLAHPNEANAIGIAGRERYYRDYTMDAIWNKFFEDLGRLSITADLSGV
ncbi:glycosyltransferase family protein [Cylindrospermopsis raciborskii]|nr:glycosyltransferase [Cylindrospermopsis raciborskii]